MPDRRDEHDRRVSWVDRDLADVLRVVETDVRPRRAGIGRLVHAIAVSNRVAQRGFAASDVNDVRRRRSDGDRTDRRDRLRIEHRRPHPSRIDRLPHATIHGAEIELVRSPRYAGRRGDASTAKGAEHAPVESRIEWAGLATARSR